MKNAILRFLKDESGVSAIEYAILASVLGVGLFVVINFTGTAISGKFFLTGSKLNNIQ